MHRNLQSILFNMDIKRKLSLVLVVFALHTQTGAPDEDGYDFYRASCPSAEAIIRSTVRELHRASDGTLGPQLLRLAFHDCFVMGCDASLLLDGGEKEAGPNLSVKGFEAIDTIKSIIEEECPDVVSCADIVAMAARESVLLVYISLSLSLSNSPSLSVCVKMFEFFQAGGLLYPVFSGRTDSRVAFRETAEAEIPSPGLNVAAALNAFAAKGFNASETVALLGGGHSTGRIHCAFIQGRLFNFQGTNAPDPSIDAEFLEVLRSQCTSPENSVPMDYQGAGNGFGEVYFRSLQQNKGLLFVDQQFTAGEVTEELVEAYSSDIPQFQRDFAAAMFKLTHLRASQEGEVRRNCRRVNGD